MLDENTLEQRPSGRITGVIFWNFDESSFPDNRWFDFPARILNWWGEAFIRLYRHGDAREQMQFMDGPFYLSLVPVKNKIEIEFIEDRNGPKAINKIVVEISQIKSTLLSAIVSLLAACKKRNFSGEDIDGLLKLIREIDELQR